MFNYRFDEHEEAKAAEADSGPSGPAPIADEDTEAGDDQTTQGEQEGELAANEYDAGDNTPILIYGIVADCLIVVPLILYIFVGESRFHLWIEITYMAWFPFGALWIISLIEDTKMVRVAMRAALNMAGMGPWAGMWAGWIAFMMGSSFTGSGWSTILWSILLVAINIGLMAMEWHVGPGVAKWIDEAPLNAVMDDEGEDAEEAAEEAAEGL